MSAANYVFSTVNGTLTIADTPATMIAVTADPGSTSIYGQALTYTAIVSQTVTGDPTPTGTVLFEIDGNPIGSAVTLADGSATSDSLSSPIVGSHTIEVMYSGDGFYATNSQAVTQTITPAPLAITADNQTSVYGSPLPTLTASYSGFVNGDTSASLSTQPTLSTTATVNSKVPGNPYTITASGAVDSNYTITYTPGILTITPADLTITADNQTMIYGAALPPLTVSYSGFENGDTPANLSTAPTLTTMATTSSHVGSYDISASGAVDPDYTIAYVDGSLSITPASLTITADNQTNVYGATLPTLTASYTGFVNGDTSASLTTLPTLSTTATSASHVADGPYAITASNAVDADYSITYVAGSLTVTTAPLLITADNQTKVYGAALPTLTASYTGFVNGDTSESLTAQPSLSTTATAASDAGGYTITASGAVDSDYSISYASGTLTITQAALTITADDQSKVYGEELPTLTASYSGFVNGDTAANLDIGPTLSTTATTNSDVGVYSITVSGAADVDYTITFVSGTLTVTSAALTITADNQTKVYGAALPMLTASYSGFVNGDTSASLTTLPTVTTTATASSDVLGSPYSITASGAADTNYTITYVAGTLTVTPATLSAVADNLSRPEGQANPPLTYTIFGLVNGDTTSVISGAPNLSTTATTASFDGQYPITITVGTLSAANYDFNTVDGIMTVTETPDTTIVLTANPGSTSTYGQSITFTATFIPFDSEAVPPTGTVAFEIDGTPIGSPVTLLDNTATSESISSLYVGLHTVEANYTGDSFYDPNSQSMTQTVTPAPLLITADNQTKVYGAAVPTLTASYSGFVNDDTPASLTTLPVLGTTATVSSDVSGNPYTITASGAVDNNYTISYVAGSLTITPAALTITADNQTSVYGAACQCSPRHTRASSHGDTAANLSTRRR